MLNRAIDWIRTVIEPLQGAAIPKASSLHTTWLLRENVTYNLEKGYNVQITLLDGRQAFDRVWIDGLFYTLYQYGMDYKLWKILRCYYHNFRCAVRIGSDISDWFIVRQGVHQGGVFSMHLYQLFINSLLTEIRESGIGCYIHGINCASPTSADDVALVAPHGDSSQKLLDIAYNHRRRWRYDHTVTKCAVIQYDKDRNVEWEPLKLGDSVIPNVTSSNHMGVPLGKVTDDIMTKMISKGKVSCYAMQGLSHSGKILDPAIASRLYWTVSVPSMMYGSEVLVLTRRQVGKLEESHRQMAKRLQGLPPSTPNPATLAQMGWVTMESHYNRNVMLFLYKILRLPVGCVFKDVALCRLTHITRSGSDSLSPLGNMFSTLKKYNLDYLVYSILNTGMIPEYSTWKRLVNCAIMDMERRRQYVATALYPSLSAYIIAVPKIEPCVWWKLASHKPQLRNSCKIMMSFVAAYNSRYRLKQCCMCDDRAANTVEHLIEDCAHFSPWRASLKTSLENECTEEYHGWSDRRWIDGILSGGCNLEEAGTIVIAVHGLIDVVQTVLAGLPGE